MEPRLGETIYVDFQTYSPETGSAADATGTPTAKVYEDGDDTPILAPTVVKRAGTTGEYFVPIACTEDNDFEADRSYNVVVTATVGGVNAPHGLARFQVRDDASLTSFLSALVPIRNQDAVTAPTLGDALLGAWCEAFGKEFVQGRLRVKRRPDSTAPVRTFTLNSATNPTARS